MLNKKSKILVVGGTGFIGKHLVSRLLKCSIKPTVIGCSTSPDHMNQSFEYVQADLASNSGIEKLQSRSFDYIFNLAGYIDHTPYLKGGRAVINNHYVGLLNLLDQLNLDGLKGFVQVGSSDEYGNNPSPQIESMREDPISPYSCAKLSSTNLIQMLAKTENFPGCVLRFFLVYGPGQNEKRFLPQIISGCLNNNTFPASEGKQIRDFCYIDDVIDAVLLAAVNPQARGEVLNIASGEPVAIKDMIERVHSLVGMGAPQFGKIAYRRGENMSLYADTNKAKSLLVWKPIISLSDGLKNTIEYYKNKSEQLIKEGSS